MAFAVFPDLRLPGYTSDHMKKYWHRLELLCAKESVDRINGLLALHAAFGWEEDHLPSGETRFVIHSENADTLRVVQDACIKNMPTVSCKLHKVAARDWLAAWREFFTPVYCGSRFVVLPPWLENDADFADRTHIVINPKSAFGTGHHATTALCLRVLSDLLESGRIVPGQTFFDLGTGSGILGIACGKSGLRGLCVDTDLLAIKNTLENSCLNATDCEIAVGSVEAAAKRKFDLVLSNILAGPLTEMAPAITGVCADGACLLLSGLLAVQADSVERAYAALGWAPACRAYDGEWCALLWR